MKPGDYVRTPNGVIAKIIDIQDEEGQYFINNNAVSLKSKTYIADKNITIGESFKHSLNILDLIEVGDYVNGKEVFTLIDNQEPKLVVTEDGCLNNKEIKSIVTREQFESMEYRIGE